MINDLDMFNDIKNPHLQARNRGVVMANIFSDHAEGDNISTKGASLLFTYFKNVPDVGKGLAFEEFKQAMTLRGYSYGGTV